MEMTQPKSSARSEMQAVTPAMPKSEQVKESQPAKCPDLHWEHEVAQASQPDHKTPLNSPPRRW